MEDSKKPQTGERPEDEKPQNERTLGLKLLDVFLYPVLTNASVFAISVVATYLTARGGDHDASGKLIYGKFGKWFQDRGDWMTKKFQAVGMSEKQADMSKMVFFSFVDGSLMAPFVKMFEDRREKIGRWLDEKMGTVPSDPGVYEAEPKQSWLSLLGGRVVTLAIVIPTAIALGKSGLNDKLFNDPGKRFGGILAKKPWVKRNIPAHYDVQELTRVGFFEAFYTSVCTLGLYFTSRRIANFHHTDGEHSEKKDTNTASVAPVEASSVEKPPETEVEQSALPLSKSYTEKHHKKQLFDSEDRPKRFVDHYHAEATSQPLMMGA